MKKMIPLVILVAAALVLAGILTYFNPLKTSIIGTHCDNAYGIPAGYQCYFYNGPNGEREGVLIIPDTPYQIPFSGEMFDPHRKIAANWKVFSDALGRFDFKVPQGAVVGQNDTKNMIDVYLGAEGAPAIAQLEYYETNGVPMEANFPEGCPSTTESFAGKDAKRFDCAATTNIDLSIKNIQLFVPVEGGYYIITGRYGGYSSYEAFVTDALLATFVFSKQ